MGRVPCGRHHGGEPRARVHDTSDPEPRWSSAQGSLSEIAAEAGGLSVQGGTLVVTDSTVRGNGSSSSTTSVVDRLEMLVTN